MLLEDGTNVVLVKLLLGVSTDAGSLAEEDAEDVPVELILEDSTDDVPVIELLLKGGIDVEGIDPLLVVL